MQTPATPAETTPPVPVQGNGTPDYRDVTVDATPEAPVEEASGPGGSATDPESGGGSG